MGIAKRVNWRFFTNEKGGHSGPPFDSLSRVNRL